MNKLYILKAQDTKGLFGDVLINERKTPKCRIIAQKEDCSEFLLLANEDFGVLQLQEGIPTGFIFTYCQAWGLTINEDVIRRVKRELRALDLIAIKAVVKDIDNNDVTLDGDVIRPQNDRPPSAILISNAYAMMADGATMGWFDATNTKRTLAKQALLEATQQIAYQVNQIWMGYE